MIKTTIISKCLLYENVSALLENFGLIYLIISSEIDMKLDIFFSFFFHTHQWHLVEPCWCVIQNWFVFFIWHHTPTQKRVSQRCSWRREFASFSFENMWKWKNSSPIRKKDFVCDSWKVKNSTNLIKIWKFGQK